MKETREEIEAQLEQSRRRLADLETRGVEALSRYDIEIAAMGDAEQALNTALYLVRNHVAYYERKLAEMPKQERLL